jgi:hypothetical protein
MAKKSGLGANLYIDGIDVSGDTNAVDQISSPRGTFDMTSIDKSAYERILGMKDGVINFTSFFNTAADRAHLTYRPLPLTDRHMMCPVTTPAIGVPTAAQRAKQIGYNGNREQGGQFLFTVESQSNEDGLNWGLLATVGKRTDTSATNGASLDGGAASAFGLQAFLQVFAFTGTDCTIKLQQSSDNGVGDAFADVTGGGFTAVTTAPGAQRIQTATNLAVERYVRVVTSGTFSSITFAVMIARNEAVYA